MLARFYKLRGVLPAIISIELCLSVLTLSSGDKSQRTFYLAEAYASSNKRSSLFVQQLEQAQAHHSSLEFYTSALNHQDSDGLSLFEHKTGDGGASDDDHLDDGHYPNGNDNFLFEEHVGDGRTNDPAASSAPDATQLSKTSRNSTGNNISAPELSLDTAPADRSLLDGDFIRRTCSHDRGASRKNHFSSTYLTYCSRYRLENLLSTNILDSIMHEASGACAQILGEFIQLDATINQFDGLFIKLLSRYNCHNGYSVKWNCDDCKKAYKDWLCATHLPYYMNAERIKPCISFCERVEQRCPYLHPITREQYGGQPVFICRDPNIPFVPEITPDIPYSEPGKCYDLCHLSENLTELVTDSLSKYDYDHCPDRGSLAGEVRNESNANTPTGLFAGQNLPAKDRPDLRDYTEITDALDDNDLSNQTDATGTPKATLPALGGAKSLHVHRKRLEELKELLANYQNQAKTHRYHADHSSAEPPSAQQELHHSS